MTHSITILWDLDGTLYPETTQIKGIFKKAAFDAVRDVVDPALTDDLVQDMLTLSRKTFGDSFGMLVHEGFSAATLHEAHHSRLDHTAITPDENTIEAFRRSRELGIRHAILSHGHEDWIKRVLDRRGLREFFADEDLITVEKIDFLKKHNGPQAFERALSMLGIEARRTIMAEDKAINLVHPHAMGMKTIEVLYGHQPGVQEELPIHVWRRCASPAETIDIAMDWAADMTSKPDATKPGPRPA